MLLAGFRKHLTQNTTYSIARYISFNLNIPAGVKIFKD